MSQQHSNLNEPWNRVIANWSRSNIAIRPGVTIDAIAKFQSAHSVVLPNDVRNYFMSSDGTGDDMDDDLYRFWPLAEVQPVPEYLADLEHMSYPDRFAYPNCFVFADHCIDCWGYGVRLTTDPTEPAPVFRITGSDPPGEQMASSFSEFMRQYADSPNNII